MNLLRDVPDASLPDALPRIITMLDGSESPKPLGARSVKLLYHKDTELRRCGALLLKAVAERYGCESVVQYGSQWMKGVVDGLTVRASLLLSSPQRHEESPSTRDACIQCMISIFTVAKASDASKKVVTAWSTPTINALVSMIKHGETVGFSGISSIASLFPQSIRPHLSSIEGLCLDNLDVSVECLSECVMSHSSPASHWGALCLWLCDFDHRVLDSILHGIDELNNPKESQEARRLRSESVSTSASEDKTVITPLSRPFPSPGHSLIQKLDSHSRCTRALGSLLHSTTLTKVLVPISDLIGVCLRVLGLFPSHIPRSSKTAGISLGLDGLHSDTFNLLNAILSSVGRQACYKKSSSFFILIGRWMGMKSSLELWKVVAAVIAVFGAGIPSQLADSIVKRGLEIVASESTEADEVVQILKAFNVLMAHCGPFFQSRQRLDQFVVGQLTGFSERQQRFAPTLSHSNRIRVELFRILRSSVFSPPPAVRPPILTTAVWLFEMGSKDADENVVSVCSEAVMACDALLHPRRKGVDMPVPVEVVGLWKEQDAEEIPKRRRTVAETIEPSVIEPPVMEPVAEVKKVEWNVPVPVVEEDTPVIQEMVVEEEEEEEEEEEDFGLVDAPPDE